MTHYIQLSRLPGRQCLYYDNMNYRLVVADVDGTLIAPSIKKIDKVSSRLQTAIKRVQQMGIIFSLATARSLDRLEGLLDSLKLTSPLILDNGARIYDAMIQKYICESLLTKEAAIAVLSFLENYPYEIFVIQKNSRIKYSAGQKLDLENIVRIMVLNILPYQAEDLYQKLNLFSNIYVANSISNAQPVKETLHVTDVGATKDQALRRISDLLGIHDYEIMTVGDSYNDLELLQMSGFKVAMGNATEEIKKIADFVAPSYKEDGLAFVLEKFIIE